VASVSSAKLFRWTKTVEPSVVEAWLKENKRNVGVIQDVKILSRGISGRVMRLEVTGSKGKTVVERELNARRLFGGLRSGLFVMEIVRQGSKIVRFEFEGAGFGHGVGMCQTGAIGLAESKKGYDEILRHYYSGIEIVKLYE
jgi:SpoIID/LytB domain protein